MKLFGSLRKKNGPSPEEREALTVRLQQWHEEGMYDKIIEKLEAMPQDRLDYDWTNRLARAYASKHDDEDAATCYAKALKLLESVAGEGRTDPYWNYRMGYVLWHMGREEEAVPFLERLLEMPKSEADSGVLDEDAGEILRRCRAVADFLDEPMEQEQAYYEKESVMIAVPAREMDGGTTLEFIPGRIAEIDGVEIVGTEDAEDAEDAEADTHDLRIRYKGGTFDISWNFIPVDFDPHSWKLRQEFTEAEMEQGMQAEAGIGVSMTFGGDYLESYHLQLKIMHAIMPDAVAVLDESAEQILLGRWVRLAAASAVPPPSDMVYVVQGVGNDDGEVWMHTHGLARCHVPELELIGINAGNANKMKGLLDSTAGVILNENEAPKPYEGIYVGVLDNGFELHVTLVPWEEAIKRFPDRMLGGKYDRKYGHNTRSAVIGYYPSEEAEAQRNYLHVDGLEDRLGDRDVYFVSTRETEHMRMRALEGIEHLVRMARETPGNALVKLRIATDRDHDGGEETGEHIWFEVVAMTTGTTFLARCLNEPLWVSHLKQGDIGTYSIDLISDWMVRRGEECLTPNDIYRL